MKITNLFKEKKKSNKRRNMKDTDGLDSDDEKFKEFDSHLINQKIKFKYPKQKPSKPQKTLDDLKNSKAPQDNDSKSTQAFSKKLEDLLEVSNLSSDKREIKDVVMKDETHKNEKVFELSSKTKSILTQVLNKKKEEKQNKISNKENDSTMLLESESKNKIKKLKNQKINNFFTTDSIFGNSKKIEPPKLSLKTIEIMKKLKEERKNRFDRPENTDKNFRSDSSFSKLRLKYEELLSKPRELRLPLKYKQLFNTFMSLEQTISLNKIRESNQMNTFGNIRNSIESVTKHTFNMKVLQQILYVVPHFYILKYIEKKKRSTFNINDSFNKDYDLIIDIPDDFNERINKNYPENFNFLSINYHDINSNKFNPCYKSLTLKESMKRKEIFKNILNRIVNVFHNKYLSKKNIKINFDPLVEKTWEHNFDPDAECEDLPLFEIPLPPNKCSVFQDTIMKNDIKNEIMKDALSMVNKSNDEEEKKASQNLNLNSNINKNNNSITAPKNKYVSQKFLEKIRAKEKANNVIKEINDYNLFHNSFKDSNAIYKEILMQMKTVLIVNKKSMELSKVSESVLNSSQLIKDSVCEEDKMAEIICMLCKKFSDFISLKNHSLLGKVVVLENNNFQIPNKISFDN
jgi:hypothetical protein